jgi:hypothetical protein
MKKTIFTLNINNYVPGITELTYPLIKRYAEKIGADFYTITERKFPKYPPQYETMQIYELGREMKNDWNIYIDSDALIHPDMFDVTEFIHKDTVCHNGSNMANNRFKYDNYFRRDGRNIGSRNWFTIASDWCIDLWHPLDISYNEALNNIFPIQDEINTPISKEHMIDDYILSRNIARFGLKFKTFIRILEDIGDTGTYLWHLSTLSTEDKIEEIRSVISRWGVSDYIDPQIPGWTNYSELIWLNLMARKMNSVVEIGSWKGRSGHALASGCKGKVYLVDNFSQNATVEPNVEKELRRNMAKFGNVQIIKGQGVEVAERFKNNSIDMVFIDGAHDRQSVYNDIMAWYPKCKKIICGHDFDRDSVKQGITDANLTPTEEVGSIWSFDKTKPPFRGDYRNLRSM